MFLLVAVFLVYLKWNASRETTMDNIEIASKGIQRYPVAVRHKCLFGIISFKGLVWTDHIVQIVNLSILGAGIESVEPLESGVIWFKKRVNGYQCGVLKWRNPSGPPYLAGIEFLSLSRHDEEYLREQVSRAKPHDAVPDPEHIITALLAAITNEHP
jgi:hypothetical protein